MPPSNEHNTIPPPPSPSDTPSRSTKKKSYIRSKQKAIEHERRKTSQNAVKASLDSFLDDETPWTKPSSWLVLDFDDESSVETFLTPTQCTKKHHSRHSLTSGGTSSSNNGWGELELELLDNDGEESSSSDFTTGTTELVTLTAPRPLRKTRSNSLTSLTRNNNNNNKHRDPITSTTPQQQQAPRRGGLGSRMDSWAVLQVDDKVVPLSGVTPKRSSFSVSSSPASSSSKTRRGGPPSRSSSLGAVSQDLKKQSRLKTKSRLLAQQQQGGAHPTPVTLKKRSSFSGVSSISSGSSVSSVKSSSSSSSLSSSRRNTPSRASSLGALSQNLKKQSRLKAKSLFQQPLSTTTSSSSSTLRQQVRAGMGPNSKASLAA